MLLREGVACLEKFKPLHQRFGVPGLWKDMTSDMAHMGTILCNTKAERALATLGGFERRKHMPAHLVVFGPESESGYLNLASALSNCHIVAICLIVRMAKHSGIDFTIQHLHALPVPFESFLVEGVVFIRHVWSHGWQLLLADGLVDVEAEHFVVQTERVIEEVVSSFFGAPWRTVQGRAVDGLARIRTLFDHVESEDVCAKANPVSIQTLTLFIANILAVNVLKDCLAVLPCT